MKRILHFGLFLSVILLSSCDNYGDKVKISNSLEVYVKKGATKEDAKAVGTYIDTTWKDYSQKKTFQLSKDSGIFELRMVVNESVKTDTSLNADFRGLRDLIQENALKGQPLKLIVTDDHLKDIRAF